MIRYQLSCSNTHAFEGWFASADAFDKQKAAGLLECPECGTTEVEKALMAPSVSTSRSKERRQSVATVSQPADPRRQELLDTMRKLKSVVTENADYVGDRFAEEARKIHFGERDARGIYGEATGEEVKSLLDDGVEILPLPDLPEDKN
ncbi:MAG: DUF1178 family protein [Rhodobiaceae bacterium]|nr:DUF1178 family protein [Rhodobiaceae bacterium]MCC0056922.1 DUF1178 family protein [Rhodobiaceae bacterium]